MKNIETGINQVNLRLSKVGILAPETIGTLVVDYKAYMKAYSNTSEDGKKFRNNFLSSENTRLILIEDLYGKAK